ncbi:hypothetical protein GCM10010505_04250 [Kitasatospora aburaviensis]
MLPGCASSNILPIRVKVFFSEAAAKTVTVPVTVGDAEAETEAEAKGLDEVLELLEEQAPSASRAAATTPAVTERYTGSPWAVGRSPRA